MGVISIAGGLQSESKCSMNDILTDAFRDFGARSRISNLWIYARSDKVFPPDFTDRLHVAFLDGGGDVKFVQFHIDGNVGNTIFGDARRQWYAQMDGFLRARQLPTWTSANVDEVIGKLKITQSNVKVFAHSLLADVYFPSPGEKALAYSQTAASTWSNATDGLTKLRLPWAFARAATLDVARKGALEVCEKTATAECTIVMENNQWVGNTP